MGKPAGQNLCSSALAGSGTFRLSDLVSSESYSALLASDASAQGSSLDHGLDSECGGRELLVSEQLCSVTR